MNAFEIEEARKELMGDCYYPAPKAEITYTTWLIGKGKNDIVRYEGQDREEAVKAYNKIVKQGREGYIETEVFGEKYTPESLPVEEVKETETVVEQSTTTVEEEEVHAERQALTAGQPVLITSGIHQGEMATYLSTQETHPIAHVKLSNGESYYCPESSLEALEEEPTEEDWQSALESEEIEAHQQEVARHHRLLQAARERKEVLRC